MSEIKPPIQQETKTTAITTNESSKKLVETKTQNISQVLTFQAKKQLKQQGKQLLLKGCYRMAAAKYTKIIEAGIYDFKPRQQAIIYLNCGICFQFMSDNNRQNYIRALEYMRSALIADYEYQKTYYRLIQLLRDNGHLQEILTLVPSTIQNKEIDNLLKEVRQQYMNESDLGKIIQKYKKQPLSVADGKALCFRLNQSIGKLLNTEVDFMSQIRNANFRTQVLDVAKQIQSVYELIGTNDIDFKNQLKTQNTETRNSLIQTFMKSVQFAFVSCIDDKAKIATVDLILQPMLKLYRGQLCKFLNKEFQFINPNLKLAKQSKFLANNQFVVQSKRTIFFKSEFQLFKYIRLIDVSLELFGKLYCYLSNKYYQRQKNKISQTLSKDSSQNDHLLLAKYIYANTVISQQVIFSGLHFTNAKIDTKMFFGAKSVYLYKYLDIMDLNFLKEVLDEECSKLSLIFGSAIIHPVWMQCFKDMIYSINKLLDILLALVDIYSYRESKTVKSLVNHLSSISQLSHLIYIYHWEVQAFNQKSQAQNGQQNQVLPSTYNFNYKYEHLLNYFEKENQNFVAIFLIEKIIQFAQQGSTNPVTSPKKSLKQSKNSEQQQDFSPYKQRTIQICMKKVKIVEKKIQEQKKNKKTEPHVYRQMYLILVCMILKLDIKRKIQIDSSIIFKEVFKEVVDDMALEVLLLLLINSPMELHKYLANQKDMTNLVQNFMSKPLIQQLQPFKILLNLIYIMICDFQNDQQIFFAKKLGVSQQEVHQVRKLQKESMEDKEKQQLNKLKKKFKIYIASQWHQILSKMCKMLRVNLKMQSECSSKLCKIIHTVGQTNHSKMYSAQIIEFMLEAKNVKDAKNSLQTNTKQTACKFFQIICKKCNAQIFEYKHIQGIVDSLLWLISNCEHQLAYFESLLGLVNLSTMTVRIPIEEIEKCLYEENSYIMHAGVCVMNNILIYSEELQEENEKNTKVKARISDLVYKYIEFYRDQIINLQIQLPQTDYSHPKKIYNSLMSLATVLKLDKLEELESWTDAIKYVKILSSNEASQLMFKLAVYHSIQKTLPRNWNQNLQQEMENLKQMDLAKYLKLTQLI